MSKVYSTQTHWEYRKGNNAVRILGTIITPCFWIGSNCRDLAFTDAPNAHNTDDLCNILKAGCLTKVTSVSPLPLPEVHIKGQRPSALVSLINATVITKRLCSDDTPTTFDMLLTLQCNCRTKGTGFINAFQPCT